MSRKYWKKRADQFDPYNSQQVIDRVGNDLSKYLNDTYTIGGFNLLSVNIKSLVMLRSNINIKGYVVFSFLEIISGENTSNRAITPFFPFNAVYNRLGNLQSINVNIGSYSRLDNKASEDISEGVRVVSKASMDSNYRKYWKKCSKK